MILHTVLSKPINQNKLILLRRLIKRFKISKQVEDFPLQKLQKFVWMPDQKLDSSFANTTL